MSLSKTEELFVCGSSSNYMWSKLPDSLLLQAFGFLPCKDIIRASEVCRNWYRISRDEMLWKGVLQRQLCIGVQDKSVLPRALSWFEEFQWLHLNTPLIESQILKEHTDEVLHVAFSHDGQILASSSKDCHVILWRLSNRCRFSSNDTCLVNFEGDNWHYVQFTEFNANDTLLLVSGVSKMREFNFRGEIIICKVEIKYMLGVQFIHKINSAPYDVFGAWLTERCYISGKFEFASPGNKHSSVSELCINYVGYEGSGTQTTLARVMNYNSSSVRSVLIARPTSYQEDDKYCVIFTHGTLTYVPHQIIFKWLKRDRSQRRPFTNAGSSALEDDIDSWCNMEEHCIETNAHIIGMNLSPDHQYLYVNCRLWQWQDCKHKAESSFPDSPPEISSDISLQVYSLSTYEMVNVHVGHHAYTANDSCFFIFLNAADRLVASGAEDHCAHVWHRDGGAKLATLVGHTNVVNSVAFNPANQQMLVSASDDHTIRVWTSRQLAKLHQDDQPAHQQDLGRESSV